MPSAAAVPAPVAFPRRIARWQLVILLALTLVRGLIYLSIFPPWLAPDEPAHFEVVRIMGQENQRPTEQYYRTHPVNPELDRSFRAFRFWELAERDTPTTWLAAHENRLSDVSLPDYPYHGHLVYAESYPLLPHWLLSNLISLAAPLDIATELYLLRLVSVLCAVAVTALAWHITRQVFPQQPQFWLAIPAFAVFLPMYTHIFAVLNTDVFAVLLSSMLLAVMVSALKNGPSWPKIGLMLGLALLAVATKRSALFTVVWAGVAMVLVVGQRRDWSLRQIGFWASVVAASTIAGFLVLLLFPVLLTELGINTFNLSIFRQLPLAHMQGQSLTELAKIYVQSAIFAAITFWGDFGWANINLPWSWFWGLMLASGIVMLAGLVYVFKKFKPLKPRLDFQQNVFLLYLAGLMLALVSTFFPIVVSGPGWNPAGRYFYPVIIPTATLLFLGVWQLCPTQYREQVALPLWLLALVGFDALTLTGVIIPYLYG